MRQVPISAAMTNPRISRSGSSWVSPAPSACAVKATVLMRRNANSQNRQSKITDAIATPPSSVASPSRPIAIVEMMPISGVVRFATIAGPAMAKTCAVVTFCGGANKTLPAGVLSCARRTKQPGQQPDRNHDHGTEQEVAPQPVDGVKAEVPQPREQRRNALADLQGIEAYAREPPPHQDRQQDQRKPPRQRRAAEKAVKAVIGCRQFPGVVGHRWSPARTGPLTIIWRRADGEPACRRQWLSNAPFYFDMFLHANRCPLGLKTRRRDCPLGFDDPFQRFQPVGLARRLVPAQPAHT